MVKIETKSIEDEWNGMEMEWKWNILDLGSLVGRKERKSSLCFFTDDG